MNCLTKFLSADCTDFWSRSEFELSYATNHNQHHDADHNDHDDGPNNAHLEAATAVCVRPGRCKVFVYQLAIVWQ